MRTNFNPHTIRNTRYKNVKTNHEIKRRIIYRTTILTQSQSSNQFLIIIEIEPYLGLKNEYIINWYETKS